jgi:hypothetical protein
MSHADARLRADARGRDGGVREELAARMKKKKERRVYLPRVLGSGQSMMPADLKRLHKYMREIEHQRHFGRGARHRRRGMAGAGAQAAAEDAARLS